MSNNALKIGGIAIGVLAGFGILSRIYNTGTQKAYAEGYAKGDREGYDTGLKTGCKIVIFRAETDRVIDHVQGQKYLDEYVLN